jgi:D-tyrosyl-tRNA(Tyr) deacylase
VIAVVQRVLRASVSVHDRGYESHIGPGLCVLLGVTVGDGEAAARWMAGKLARLRIFRDEDNKMNRSVQDIGGSVLVVSQFTLAGDCSRGNRPSFVQAAAPEIGNQLYEKVCELLSTEHKLDVKTGIFGAMMAVELANDGPVTLILTSPESITES